MLDLRGSIEPEPELLSDTRGCIGLHSGDVSQMDDFNSALKSCRWVRRKQRGEKKAVDKSASRGFTHMRVYIKK